jgi:hypothetical protein
MANAYDPSYVRNELTVRRGASVKQTLETQEGRNSKEARQKNGRAKIARPLQNFLRAIVQIAILVRNSCSKANSLDGGDNRRSVKVFAGARYGTYSHFVYSYTR